MTTQAQLMELALSHGDNPYVADILASISESTLNAKMALGQTETASAVLLKGVEGEEGYSVPRDSSHFVAAAAKAAASLTCLALNYQQLAIVLERLGEDISY